SSGFKSNCSKLRSFVHSALKDEVLASSELLSRVVPVWSTFKLSYAIRVCDSALELSLFCVDLRLEIVEKFPLTTRSFPVEQSRFRPPRQSQRFRKDEPTPDIIGQA